MASAYRAREGEWSEFAGGKPRGPDRPVIPDIEGDGTGPDIWRVSQRVLDAAVRIACSSSRGIAPGASIGDRVGLFEGTHGTAPRCAGLDMVNPGSVILSAA